MTAFRIHPHARERMKERGVSEADIETALRSGEQFPAKFGRIGFRHNFPFDSVWHNEFYKVKQVEVLAIREDETYHVITVISKFF